MTTDATDGAQGRNEPLLKLDEFLPYKLNVLAETVREPLSRHYADRHGIGVPEWRVAAVLGQHGTMTAKEIGAIGRMHKTKVSRALAVLEAKGLVARETNRSDMREAFVSLTESGRRLYMNLADTALVYGERLQGALSDEEYAAFDQMLKRLIAHSESLAKEFRNGRVPDGPANGNGEHR